MRKKKKKRLKMVWISEFVTRESRKDVCVCVYTLTIPCFKKQYLALKCVSHNLSEKLLMPTAAKGPTSPREAKPKFLVCPLFSTHKHFCMAQANVFNWAFKA